MTKTTETWEERFDQAFLDVMYKDDGYTEERAVLKAFIRAEIALARQEEAVAYGGCTNCYGKGYSTTKMYASGRRFTQEQNPYIPCKECDRGAQFAKTQELARQEGERKGREKTVAMMDSLATTEELPFGTFRGIVRNPEEWPELLRALTNPT